MPHSGPATSLLAEHALPETDIEWLMTLDASGHTPKLAVSKAIADCYGAALPVSAIRTLLDRGAADRVVPAEPPAKRSPRRSPMAGPA